MIERRRFRVTGTVQGVGFRPFVYRIAGELGLAGRVANDSQGVWVEAEGDAVQLDELERRLGEDAPPLARVADIVAVPIPVTGEIGFAIVASSEAGPPVAGVSVDVATCADCRRELLDPGDRRFGYPFINCTNCGPRYTIVRSIPYDRATTTMAGFTMCARCQGEYDDPGNRRFHAEPNACPVCGPQVRLLAPDGTTIAERDAAIDAAAAALLAGLVVGVKGLGGYHLAVDATNVEAVALLRQRKHRDDKAFAVMVADVATARSLCVLSPAAEAALSSPRRPIVLAPRRQDAPVAPAVAPGLAELGLMLAYTPLHELLLDRMARPLVMTSGNLSDEPIAHDDDDALERLGPLVDVLLTHDRAIHIRCDDSVVRSRDSAAVQMVRRSRGFAPESLALPVAAARPLLAVGAELKNTISVAKNTTVIASHHIGDLEHFAAHRSFLQAVDHLCRLAGVIPELVAHDLHPEYLSTKFAMDLDLPLLGVQHHHAHIASCLVEHGVRGPVLGVAYDGLGLSCDGQLWGGEFMVADLVSFERVGHLRPVPLAGGARAIREPWRMALAWALLALGPDAAGGYGSEVDERWEAVLALAQAESTATTTSAGRLFDAVAALLGIRPRISYEGQAAIELEAAAAAVTLADAPVYDLAVHRTVKGMVVLDPAPMIARVVAERDRGTAVATIAAGFHAGLGEATAALAIELAQSHGLATIALSGGVFQNVRLTEVVSGAIERAGLVVLVHERVPPNDGGISIGQAAIAAATDAQSGSWPGQFRPAQA